MKSTTDVLALVYRLERRVERERTAKFRLVQKLKEILAGFSPRPCPFCHADPGLPQRKPVPWTPGEFNPFNVTEAEVDAALDVIKRCRDTFLYPIAFNGEMAVELSHAHKTLYCLRQDYNADERRAV